MDIVQLVEAEDSLGFVFPDTVLARLNLAVGDTVFLAETPGGILLTRVDADKGQALTDCTPDPVP